MTLDKAKVNQLLKIKHIDGGFHLRQRLNQMGIFEGEVVHIKRASSLGAPIILEANNSEIAIGRGMAAKISVVPHEQKNRKNSSNR